MTFNLHRICLQQSLSYTISVLYNEKNLIFVSSIIALSIALIIIGRTLFRSVMVLFYMISKCATCRQPIISSMQFSSSFPGQ